MVHVSNSADTPEGLDALIRRWRNVDLAAQHLPTDLLNLTKKRALWESAFEPSETCKLAAERERFEHRHRYWTMSSTARPDCTETAIDLPLGNERTMGARCFAPQGRCEGTICFLHGGGWVLGSVATHQRLCQVLAESTSMQVVSLDYPRAPETRYPDIVDILNTAVDAVAPRAGPRVLVGDSAGATLAFLLAQQPKQQSKWDGVALFYGAFCPELDLRSHRDTSQRGQQTLKRMAWYWDHFLPNRRTFSILPEDAAKDPPPYYLACGGTDFLLDDTLMMTQALADSEADVSLIVEPGLPHGYLQMTDHVMASRHSVQALNRWLKRLRPNQSREST